LLTDNPVLKGVLLLVGLSLPSSLVAEDKPASPPRDDQFIHGADLPYGQILDEHASREQRDFTTQVIRFGISGRAQDYELIAERVNKDYQSILESGQGTFGLAVNRMWPDQAIGYFKLYELAYELRQPRESLDAILHTLFYEGDNWLLWALASDLYSSPWAEDSIKDPVKAEQYAKIALCLRQRDAAPYYYLIRAYVAQRKYAEVNAVASKALEIVRFDIAKRSFLKNDLGRGYFLEQKGRALTKTGDPTRGRDYLQMAAAVKFPMASIPLYSVESIKPYPAGAKHMKLGSAKSFGFSYVRGRESIRITKVLEGSPAAVAGMRRNDDISSVNGAWTRSEWGEQMIEDVTRAIIEGDTSEVLLQGSRVGQREVAFILTK